MSRYLKNDIAVYEERVINIVAWSSEIVAGRR